MLLAVEGGGFFSSSASGYSKGLTLLFLGQRNCDNDYEDKPMRVAPLYHYRLVEQEPYLDDLQLASSKNQVSRGCASFICFSHASPKPNSPSPIKIGPSHSGEGKDHKNEIGDDGNRNVTEVLKSSLKRSANKVSVPTDESDQQRVTTGMEGGDNSEPGHTGRRKVQWTDVCGNELVEIKEFEPSETGGPEDELSSGNERICSCSIM